MIFKKIKARIKNYYWIDSMLKQRLYFFTFSDKLTKRIETLQIKAASFAETLPEAFVYRQNLNKRHDKSNWDIISIEDKNFYNER